MCEVVSILALLPEPKWIVSNRQMKSNEKLMNIYYFLKNDKTIGIHITWNCMEWQMEQCSLRALSLDSPFFSPFFFHFFIDEQLHLLVQNYDGKINRKVNIVFEKQKIIRLTLF